VLVSDNPTLARDAVGPSTPTVENRRFQDARAGENAPKSGTTIGEGRQHGVPVSADRIEVLPDQRFDVRRGFRDAAENLTATSLRFDIANPHLEVTFVVLAAPDEGGVHGDRDRRHHRRRRDRGTVDERGASLQGMAAQRLRIRSGVDRKHLLQQVSRHLVAHQGGMMSPEQVQLRCRAAMRWPVKARLDAAARAATEPGQPHRDLTEERCDRVVAVIFHPANILAAGTNRPPDRMLARLCGGDLALNPRQQLFCFREGQSQIGDIAEVVRPADLHDVHGVTFTPGCRQPQNPLHAPPPSLICEQERKYPARTSTPSFAVVPVAGVRRLYQVEHKQPDQLWRAVPGW
jgi:hypothetical protein